MRKTQEQVKAELQARLSQYQAAQKSRRRFLLTGGALVLVCAVVLLAVMLPLSKSEPPVSEESSAAPSQDTVSSEYVLPPVRVGEHMEQASLGPGNTLESAYEKADVVALVRIGDWMEEEIEYDATLYHVDVLEQYKGEPLDSFVFRQDGCSRSTFIDYPLFKGGNEVLLFLKEATLVDENGELIEPNFEYKGDYYFSLNAWETALTVVTDDAGNRYISDTTYLLEENYNELTNYGNYYVDNETAVYHFAEMRPELADEIYENAIEKDVYSRINFKFLFSQEEIASLLNACEESK